MTPFRCAGSSHDTKIELEFRTRGTGVKIPVGVSSNVTSETGSLDVHPALLQVAMR